MGHRQALSQRIVNRRTAARVDPGPLPIEFSNGHRGNVVNVSETGALIHCPLPLGVGDDVDFVIRWNQVTLEGSGVVARCEISLEGARLTWADGPLYRVAVHFAAVSPSSATLVQVVRSMRRLLRDNVLDFCG